MGMVVRTNTMSANAYRQLGANNTQLSKSLEKLSSGYRINRAGDDSSGLAISEKMKAQIAGLDQASANSQDGISLVQTAEGALTEVHSMLNRMVTLADKSANGTVSNEVDRAAIQTETDALKSEITRISQSTNFNGITLLDGKLGAGTPTVTGGVKFDETNTSAYTISATAIAPSSTAIDGTETYSVGWTNANGEYKTTSIAFTGSTSAALKGNNGTSTTIATNDGKPTATEWGNALAAELNANSEFSSAFTVTNSAGALTFTSKTEGSNGPSIISQATNGTGKPTLGTLGTATKGTDAGFKFDVTGAKVATTGGTAEDYAKQTFTLDGKKFMLAKNSFTATDTAKVASDVNVITLTGTTYAAASDASNVAAALNKANGTTEYSVATATNTNAGIQANDIIFTSATKGLTLQVGDTNDSYNKVTVSVGDMSAKGLGIDTLDVSTQTAASSSINTIKAAINTVSTNRGNLGALQNRLEHAISNLNTTSENMDAANSAIRDTDMAKEMMNYTKMTILSQAAQAMLAQANQQPQNILQLLK